MDKIKWEAIYMPMTDNGYNPSKGGFDSYEGAWKWVYNNHLCDDCILEIEEEKMNPEYEPHLACAAEWCIDEEDDR